MIDFSILLLSTIGLQALLRLSSSFDKRLALFQLHQYFYWILVGLIVTEKHDGKIE